MRHANGRSRPHDGRDSQRFANGPDSSEWTTETTDYTEGELETALRNYEAFHRLPFHSATVEQLQSSSAGIDGWLRPTWTAQLRASPYIAESSRFGNGRAPSLNHISPDFGSPDLRPRPRDGRASQRFDDGPDSSRVDSGPAPIHLNFDSPDARSQSRHRRGLVPDLRLPPHQPLPPPRAAWGPAATIATTTDNGRADGQAFADDAYTSPAASSTRSSPASSKRITNQIQHPFGGASSIRQAATLGDNHRPGTESTRCLGCDSSRARTGGPTSEEGLDSQRSRMDSFRRRNKMIAGTKLAVEDAERREESVPSEELSKSRPATARNPFSARSARSPFSARRAAVVPALAIANLDPAASPQNATRLAELQAELNQAIEARDYAKAAELVSQMEAAVVVTDNGSAAPPAAANDDGSSDLGSGCVGSGMPRQMGGIMGGDPAVAAEVEPNHMPADPSLDVDVSARPEVQRTPHGVTAEPEAGEALSAALSAAVPALIAPAASLDRREGEQYADPSLEGEPPSSPPAVVPGLATAPAMTPRTSPMAPSPATGGRSGRADGGRPSEAGSVTGSRESSPSLKAQGKLAERNDAYVKKAPTVAEPRAAEAVSLAQTDPAWIEANAKRREVALKALSAWNVPALEFNFTNPADSARYAPQASVRALAEKKLVANAIPTIEVYMKARSPLFKQGLQNWLFRARERMHPNTGRGRVRKSVAMRQSTRPDSLIGTSELDA